MGEISVSRTALNSQRNQMIDYAKGMGIVLVVMYHAQFLDSIWIQFHMPLFAFLSGMLYKESTHANIRSIFSYIKKQVKKLYLSFIKYELAFLAEYFTL